MKKENERIIGRSDVFKKYFPLGDIRTTEMNSLPPKVIDFFEFRSRRFILPEEYKSGDFSVFYIITHNSSELTYVAQQSKTYDSGNTELLTYLIDINQSGEIQGDGEIRYNPTTDESYFKNKPFTGWIGTEEAYWRKGLGQRRLFIMNALSQMLYGLPLHSDTIILDQAKGLFEKLAAEGKMKKYLEGTRGRYVFTE